MRQWLVVSTAPTQSKSAAAGIQEYWVINLQQSVSIVFRDLTTAGYQSEPIFATGTISPVAFSDVAIDLQQLLASDGVG